MNFLIQEPALFEAGNEALLAGGIFAAIMAFALIGIVLILATYVYFGLVLMTLAKKTNTPRPWLAWIPFANVYLLTQIAQVPWWTLLVIFTGLIPGLNIIGGPLNLGVGIWWWWKIAERRNRPGWWGILMILPVVNFVLAGILAWGEAGTTPAAKPTKAKPVEKPAKK